MVSIDPQTYLDRFQRAPLNSQKRALEILRRLREASEARLARQVDVPIAPPPDVEKPAIPIGVNVPLRTKIASTAAPKPELGSFFGSGVLENVFSGAQKLSETGGGLAVNAATLLMPGEQMFEKKFKEVVAERGGEPGLADIGGQAQVLAESFRRTDFPKYAKGTIEVLEPLSALAGAGVGKAVGGVLKGARAALPASQVVVPRVESAASILTRADQPGLLKTASLGVSEAAAKPGVVGRAAGPIKWGIEAVGGRVATLRKGDHISRAVQVYTTREDSAPSLITRALLPVQARFPELFKLDATGNILNIGSAPGASRQVSQVFEDALEAKFAYQFTPEQAKLIADFHAVIDDAVLMMKQAGVDIDQTFLEGAGSKYFPRLVAEYKGIAKEAAQRKSGLGAKPAFSKVRSYVGQEIEAGVANGIKYESDPMQIVGAFLSGAYRAVRTKELADALRPLAIRTAEGTSAGARKAAARAVGEAQAARGAIQALQRMVRGETLPPSTLKNVKAAFPQFAPDINMAVGLKPQEFDKAVGAVIDDVVRITKVDKARLQQAITAERLLRSATGHAVTPAGERLLTPDKVQDFIVSLRELTPTGKDFEAASIAERLLTGKLAVRVLPEDAPVTRDALRGALIRVRQTNRAAVQRSAEAQAAAGKVVGGLFGTTVAAVPPRSVPTGPAHLLARPTQSEVMQALSLIREQGKRGGGRTVTAALRDLPIEERKAAARAVDLFLKNSQGEFEQAVAEYRRLGGVIVEERRETAAALARLNSINTRAANATTKIFREGYRQAGLTSRNALRQVIAAAEPEAKTLANKAREARRISAASTAAARVAGVGEAQIISSTGLAAPLLPGHFFLAEDAAKIVKNLGLGEKSTFEKLADGTGSVGDAIRTSRAGLDFGAPLIQGLLLLVKSPDKWAKGVALQFRAFADEKFYADFLNNRLATLDEMLAHNIPLSRNASDYYLGIQRGGLLQKGLRKLPVAGEPALDALARFERSFNFLGDYARISLWEAFKDTAQKAGPKGLDDLASIVTNGTGALSPSALGIARSQQAIERGWLFFSARYTRASLALISDVTKGGVRGQIARELMVKAGMGGLIAYYLTAEALGQEPKLDPSKSDFMTVRVGKDNIGIGSFFTSFVRLIGKSVAEPGSLLETDLSDNPLAVWVRGRAAPPGGIAWDIGTGHDFIGTPIEGPVDIALHIGEQSLPFVAETALLQSPAHGGAAAIISETVGARTSPLSLSARRNLLRNELAGMKYPGQQWDDLNRLQQHIIEDALENKELADLTVEARASRLLRGDEIDALVDDYFKEFERADALWDGVVARGYQQILNGTIDLPAFRERVLTNANNERRAAIHQVVSDERYAPAREWLDELPKRVGQSPELPEDFAYLEYIRDILADTSLQQPSGYDFEEAQRRKEAFRLRWGTEVTSYVQQRLGERRDIPAIVQELYDQRDRFAYYWGNPDLPDSVVGAVISARPDAADMRMLYQRWNDATENERAVLEETHRGFDSMLKTISRVRAKLRDGNPELDLFLFRWGYTSTLSHPQNQAKGAREQARLPQPRQRV